MTVDKLSRIRDNQRRSRARRKEYQHELEAKVRRCETLGVEASTKIQMAARKVLDENARLRLLLRAKGVDDAEVDAFVAWPADDPKTHLESLLTASKPCSAGTTELHDSEEPAGMTLREGESPSEPLQPLLDDKTRSQMQSDRVTSSHRCSQIALDSTVTETGQPEDHHRRLECSATIMRNATSDERSTARSTTVPTPHSGDSISCIEAANIIRGMRSDVGPELEDDLGCSQPGSVCPVRHSFMFDVMDKYSRSNHQYT